ncbi:PREDICTED: Ig-like V-type domain-containing protein FAM187A [Priapulus caudatus]|uniref:Ig-like V-type domain-containing protein FAM187A n=1 Tax=Priapulus caudatus TaxID=37621 RepID=A0ABM1EFQ9_PRICU|nr:PREDICTED: Ig-like V-type domain-containing protein FAM187A [Priapulus caudatus]
MEVETWVTAETAEQEALEKNYHECLQALNNDDVTVREKARLVLEQQSIELPCGMCQHPDREASEYRGKWKRVLQMGEERVEHDSENIVITSSSSLFIRRAQLSDAGQYLCIWLGQYYSVYRLDVVRTEKRAVVYDTDIKGARPAKPKALPQNNLQLFTSWTDWSDCTLCGMPGRRHKIGICTLKKLDANESVKPVDLSVLHDYPGGVPCRSSALPEYFASMGEIWSRRSETLVGTCEVACPTVPAETNITDENGIIVETVRTGEGLYSIRLPPPSIPPMVKRKTVYESEGSNIELVCPNSDSTTGVTWQNNTEIIDPIKIRRFTRGRIIIDDKNALRLRRLTLTDTSLYSCWMNQRLVATVRIVVTLRDSSRPSDYIAFAGFGAAMLTVLCICCTACKNRKKQTVK